MTDSTATPPAAAAGQEKVVHPLLAKPYRCIRDWAEWLKMWDRAETVEELLGLLHVGFDVRWSDGEKPYKKIAFYLAVADSFTQPHHLGKTRDSRYYPDKFEPGAVALKAMQVLCLRVFRTPKEARERDLYWYRWTGWFSPSLFLALLDFLCRDDFRNVRTGYSNLAEPHQEIYRQFQRDFINRAWRLYNDSLRPERMSVEEANYLRPVITENLGRLLRLALYTGYTEVLSNDTSDQTLAVLEAFVFDPANYSAPYNQTAEAPKTVEEAMVSNTSHGWWAREAARRLLVLRAMRKEQDRQAAVEAAEKARTEAEKELKRLQAQPRGD